MSAPDFSRIEEVINWIFPGLTMYYRDSELPPAITNVYQPGLIFRSPTFVDAAGFGRKPVKNTRFIIASSKAAPLYRVNPDVAQYQLHSIDCNSYFKVLDVYEAYGIRQIFLLHIPSAGVEMLRAIVIRVGERNLEQEIIEKARKSLHDKWIMEPAAALEDAHWTERTAFPIGLDPENQLFPLAIDRPLIPMAAMLSSSIRKMTEDTGDLNQGIYAEGLGPDPAPAATGTPPPSAPAGGKVETPSNDKPTDPPAKKSGWLSWLLGK